MKLAALALILAWCTTRISAAYTAPKFLPENVAQWQSKGCYKDDLSNPTTAGLNDGSFVFTNGMSLEWCRDRAIENNRRYFAVSNRDECHWGQKLSPTAKLTAESECLERCPGGPANRQCGGKNRMTVYENLWMPALPQAPEWLDNGWHYIGCRRDSAGNWNQGLSGGGLIFYGGMSLNVCREVAKSFKYFAVAGQDACYVGNTLASTSSVINNDSCFLRCTPDQWQPCGGTEGANTYENTNYVAPAQAPGTIGKWQTLGCWSDSSSDRTLRESGYNNYGSMTLNECLNAAGNALYAGVEYGGECYWSTQWVSQSKQQSDSDCNIRCPGNNNQLCGAGNRLNLYFNSQFIQPKANNLNNWIHQGCLGDSTSARTLRDGAWSDYSGMTLQRCSERAAGYQFFALEYGGECYWGNTIYPTGNYFADSSCNMGCSGNMQQACGAGGKLNLYKSNTYVPPLVINPGTATWKYQGCYTDNADSHALTNLYEDWGAMRVSRCLAKAVGYKYAGTEYYGQCWYGNTLSSQVAGNQADCNTPCKGFPGEACGGSNRLSLYLNEAYVQPAVINQGPINGFMYVTCYTDNETARTLEFSLTDCDGMTVAKCIAAAAGYKYAAVEYYGQCWYGNIIKNGQSASADTCNTACAGNQNELCGGAARLGLYQNQNYVPQSTSIVNPPSSTRSSVTSSIAITPTSSIAVSTATVNPGVGTFVSRGCYVDSSTARALSEAATPDWTGNTVAKCISKASGYRYAAVEYYGECYYGNILSANTAPEAECNTACAGNTGELCGGGNRVNVYENTAYVIPASENPGIGSFRSLGCRIDSGDSRALTGGTTTDWSSMTVAKCIAAAAGFRYAGVEYYGECYWGNVLATSAIAAGDCNTKCTGNQTEFCGGSARINIYEDKSLMSTTTTAATTTRATTTSTISPTTVPTANPGINYFELKGCYTDSSTDRALRGGSTSDPLMNVAQCVSLAGSSKYAAVGNHADCYWGDSLHADPANDGCSFACGGNTHELCGGSNRIILYQNADWVDPNPTLDELISIVNNLASQVSELAGKVQIWQNAVIDYHNTGGTRKVKRQPNPTAKTTALDAARGYITKLTHRIGTRSAPGPDSKRLLNYIEMDDRSADPRSPQMVNQGRALMDQSDSMSDLVLSSRASSPDTEIDVVSDVSSIVGATSEAEAVVQAGYGALATGLTIFGFSLTKLLAMLSIVLVHILEHPIITIPNPTTTIGTGATSTSISTSTTTTSSAAAAATTMVILTDTGTSVSDFNALVSGLGVDQSLITTMIYPNVDFQGLVAPLNASQQQNAVKNPIVKVMAENVIDYDHDFNAGLTQIVPTRKREVLAKRAITTQPNSATHLKTISKPSSGIDTEYTYDNAAAGHGVNIYFLDTGVRASHQDFAGLSLVTHVAKTAGPSTNDEYNHGTTVVSVAAGIAYGVSKNANLIMVKVNYDNIPLDQNGNSIPFIDKPQFGLFTIVDGLMWIMSDVNTKVASGLLQRGKAVINISLGFSQNFGVQFFSDNQVLLDTFPFLLLQLDRYDIVLVTSAGNTGGDIALDGLKKFGGPSKSMIVVGGVEQGTLQIWPQSGVGNALTVRAESTSVNSAGNASDTVVAVSMGTSQAAGQVSGLAAYFLSKTALAPILLVEGQVSRRVKQFISASAKARVLPGTAASQIACNGENFTPDEVVLRDFLLA